MCLLFPDKAENCGAVREAFLFCCCPLVGEGWKDVLFLFGRLRHAQRWFVVFMLV